MELGLSIKLGNFHRSFQNEMASFSRNLRNKCSVIVRTVNECNFMLNFDIARLFTPRHSLVWRNLHRPKVYTISNAATWSLGGGIEPKIALKAVCHVNDWLLQSELNTTEFFVNLCICNKGGLIFLTFYGRRKSEDHQPLKFLFFVLSLSPNQMRDRLPLRDWEMK